MTQKLIELAGMGKERLHLAWVSSAEAQRFVEVVLDVTTSIRHQGKFDPKAFELELAAAEMTVSGETLRWLVGKEIKMTSKGDVYGRKWDVEQYESILDNMLKREYHKNLIYQAIKGDCPSVREISKRTGLELQRVSYLLADLEKTNRVVFRGMENRKPVFAAL